MIKGLFITASCLLIAALALNGCEKADSTEVTPAPSTTETDTIAVTKTPQQAIKLTLSHSLIEDSSSQSLQILEAAVAATERDIPELEIVLEGVDENLNRSTQLKAEMAAGAPPDIFELFGGETDAFTYAEAGKLLDLTPILNELEKQYDFANLDAFTWDNKIIGLPLTGEVKGVFYNKKIFADLGVMPPTSYAEFMEICELAFAKGITPLALAAGDTWVPIWLMNSLLVRDAGAAVHSRFKTGAAKWTDPAVVYAFAQYEELVTKGYFSPDRHGLKYAEQQNQFKAGSAAMLYDGSWTYASLIDPETSKIANDVGFFNFPDTGGEGDGLINGSFNQGYGFSEDLSEAKLAAVKQFIKNLYNDESQKKQLEAGVFPSMFLLDNTGVPSVVVDIISATKSAAGTYADLETKLQKPMIAELEEGLQRLLEGKTTAIELTKQLQLTQEVANAN